MDPGPALRHDRGDDRRGTLRDHHAPCRGVPLRQPEAGGGLQRHRPADRPRAPGLHGQRDGARGHRIRAGSHRPLRGNRRPGEQAAPDAPGRRDLLQRRPTQDDARSAVHGEVRPGPRCGAGVGCAGRRGAAGDRVGRAGTRRALQAGGGRGPLSRAVVPLRHDPRRGGAPRTPCHAGRTGSDPPPQGRADPHHRRGRQGAPEGEGAPCGTVPRHRQAGHAVDRGSRCLLPPPRSGRSPHDPQAHEGTEVLERDDRRRDQARVPAPSDAHLPARLDRLGGAPLRAGRG